MNIIEKSNKVNKKLYITGNQKTGNKTKLKVQRKVNMKHKFI